MTNLIRIPCSVFLLPIISIYRKSIHLLLILFSTIILSNNVMAESLLNFNFKNNILSNGFGSWQYVDKGTNPCNIYAGESFSKLCSNSGFKFYPYYNYRNNNHMGWLRYGFIDSDNIFSITGSSLKVTLTGGAYATETGKIAYLGDPIFSKSDFINSRHQTFTRPLPGAMSFYYKGGTSYSTFPALQNNNRLNMWVLMPKIKKNIDYYATSASLRRPNNTFSMFPFINRSTGGHYYHTISNIPMGGWTKIQFDAHPVHFNGGDKNPYSAYSVGGYEYAGDGISYFNNIATLSFVAGFSANQPSPYSFYIDDLSTSLVLYENDETINNVAVGYDQQNKFFDLSFSDKYRCLECSAKYIVKYSFKPINLNNFNQAFLPKTVINFDRSKNNTLGEIYKPNAGYNNIWAALTIQKRHLNKLKNGVTIYFAIKDISNRSNINQDPIDFAEQLVPNIGNVKTIDLLKTIDYPIHFVNYPLEIKNNTIDFAIKNHYFSSKIVPFGGLAPYQIISTKKLPLGISLNTNGLLFGTPQVSGNFNIVINLTDAHNNKITKTIPWTIKTEADFNQTHCTEIVDFGATQRDDIISSSAFNTIIGDKYTGNFKLGKTIIIGKNGSYDFQGVQGAGLNLVVNDTIRSIWYNNSGSSITFTPMISFDDANRRFFAPSGQWFPMKSITIKANQYQVSDYVIPQKLAGKINLININANFNNNKQLILDKIEYSSAKLPVTALCIMPFPTSKAPEQLVVDFINNNADSLFSINGWNTIIKDRYTNYYQDGLTITIGSNSSYDFQGVTGTGRKFKAGDTITAYWHNISSATVRFTPNISFTDIDRIFMGSSGEWFKMSSVDILSKQIFTSKFTFNANSEGWYSLININGNVKNNRQIILDKITLTSP